MRHSLLGLVLLAAVLWICMTASAQTPDQAAKNASTPTKASPPNQADFLGFKACQRCHAEIATNFSTNPHFTLALKQTEFDEYGEGLPFVSPRSVTFVAILSRWLSNSLSYPEDSSC